MSEAKRERLQQVLDTLATMEGVYAQDIRNFIDGEISVNAEGQLHLQLGFPASEIMQDPEDVGCIPRGQWKMVPLIVFVEEEPGT